MSYGIDPNRSGTSARGEMRQERLRQDADARRLAKDVGYDDSYEPHSRSRMRRFLDRLLGRDRFERHGPRSRRRR